MYKGVVLVFGMGIIGLFGWQIWQFQRLTNRLNHRALIVVIDGSNYLIPEDVSFYENNKQTLVPILSAMFGVKKEEISDLGAIDISENYGIPWLGKNILKSAEQYGKKVLLIKDAANLDNLRSNIADFNKQGYVVDILILAHGNEQFLLLNGQNISFEEIKTSLAPVALNLGYVYLSSCYGAVQTEVWHELGAKAVNGANALNNYAIISPMMFLTAWTNGESFEKSVNNGYAKEIFFWKTLRNFFPGMNTWVNDDATMGGKMQFAGDQLLNVYDN